MIMEALAIGSAIASGISSVINYSNSQKQAALSYKNAAAQADVSIAEAQSDISQYEQFLANFSNTETLKKTSYETEAKGQYATLIGNMGLADAASAATGRTGASVQAIGNQVKQKVVDYAGADLALGGGDGGLYELGKTELQNELDSEKLNAEQQVSVLQTSLATFQQAKASYEDAADKADHWFSSLFS